MKELNPTCRRYALRSAGFVGSSRRRVSISINRSNCLCKRETVQTRNTTVSAFLFEEMFKLTVAIFIFFRHDSTHALSAGGSSLPLSAPVLPSPYASRMNSVCFKSILKSVLSRRSSNASEGSSMVSSAISSLVRQYWYRAVYNEATQAGGGRIG